MTHVDPFCRIGLCKIPTKETLLLEHSDPRLGGIKFWAVVADHKEGFLSICICVPISLIIVFFCLAQNDVNS